MATKSQVDSVQEVLSYFKSSARPSKAVGVETNVLLVTGSTDEFVHDELNELRANGHGIFSRLKHKKEDYFEYQCERHNKPRGRSSGLSTKTRANRCTAFVSFKFVCHGDVVGCIRRLRSRHNGHDPSSITEKCVGTRDKAVTSVIETLAFNGKTPSDIMKAIKVWAEDKGHADVKDRRYHPSLQDVNNTLKSYRKHLRFDADDLLCVEQLLQTELRESCLSYCPLTLGPTEAGGSLPTTADGGHGSGPPGVGQFHVLLQSPEQGRYLETVGAECQLAFITLCGPDSGQDKRERQCGEKQPRRFSAFVLSLPGMDRAGGEVRAGVPVASVLAERGNTQGLVAGLLALRENHPHFYPSAFMAERDEHVSSCIKQVWPDSIHLWPWPSVLQTAGQWVSGVGKLSQSGDTAHCRHLLLRSLWTLKLCTTKRQFHDKSQLLMARLDKMTTLSAQTKRKCQTYLETEWLPYADRWSDCGREFLVTTPGSSQHIHLAALDGLFCAEQRQYSACGFSQKLDFLLLKLHHSPALVFAALRAPQGNPPPHSHPHSQFHLHPHPHPTLQENQSTDSHPLHPHMKTPQLLCTNVPPPDSCHQRKGCVCCGASLEVCRGREGETHEPLSDSCHKTKGCLNCGASQEACSRRQEKGQGSLDSAACEAGWLDGAVWLGDGRCVVRSDWSLFVSWTVDFVAGVCSCPHALMEGNCRHLRAEPSERKERILRIRKDLARDIQTKGFCHLHGNRLYVFCAKNLVYSLLSLDGPDPAQQGSRSTGSKARSSRHCLSGSTGGLSGEQTQVHVVDCVKHTPFNTAHLSLSDCVKEILFNDRRSSSGSGSGCRGSGGGGDRHLGLAADHEDQSVVAAAAAAAAADVYHDEYDEEDEDREVYTVRVVRQTVRAGACTDGTTDSPEAERCRGDQEEEVGVHYEEVVVEEVVETLILEDHGPWTAGGVRVTPVCATVLPADHDDTSADVSVLSASDDMSTDVSVIPAAVMDTPAYVNVNVNVMPVVDDTPSDVSVIPASVIDTPADVSVIPASVIDTPADISVIPASVIDTPADISVIPASVIDTPADVCVTSAAVVDMPAEVTVMPASGDTPVNGMPVADDTSAHVSIMSADVDMQGYVTVIPAAVIDTPVGVNGTSASDDIPVNVTVMSAVDDMSVHVSAMPDDVIDPPSEISVMTDHDIGMTSRVIDSSSHTISTTDEEKLVSSYALTTGQPIEIKGVPDMTKETSVGDITDSCKVAGNAESIAVDASSVYPSHLLLSLSEPLTGVMSVTQHAPSDGHALTHQKMTLQDNCQGNCAKVVSASSLPCHAGSLLSQKTTVKHLGNFAPADVSVSLPFSERSLPLLNTAYKTRDNHSVPLPAVIPEKGVSGFLGVLSHVSICQREKIEAGSSSRRSVERSPIALQDTQAVAPSCQSHSHSSSVVFSGEPLAPDVCKSSGKKLEELSTTRRMIDKLAEWVRSESFVDDADLKAAVTSAYDIAFSRKAGSWHLAALSGVAENNGRESLSVPSETRGGECLLVPNENSGKERLPVPSETMETINMTNTRGDSCSQVPLPHTADADCRREQPREITHICTTAKQCLVSAEQDRTHQSSSLQPHARCSSVQLTPTTTTLQPHARCSSVQLTPTTTTLQSQIQFQPDCNSVSMAANTTLQSQLQCLSQTMQSQHSHSPNLQSQNCSQTLQSQQCYSPTLHSEHSHSPNLQSQNCSPTLHSEHSHSPNLQSHKCSPTQQSQRCCSPTLHSEHSHSPNLQSQNCSPTQQSQQCCSPTLLSQQCRSPTLQSQQCHSPTLQSQECHCHSLTEMTPSLCSSNVEVTSSSCSSNVEVTPSSSSTSTCLDDLVRRLEARQQWEDAALIPASGGQSPAKKGKLEGPEEEKRTELTSKGLSLTKKRKLEGPEEEKRNELTSIGLLLTKKVKLDGPEEERKELASGEPSSAKKAKLDGPEEEKEELASVRKKAKLDRPVEEKVEDSGVGLSQVKTAKLGVL